MTTYRITIEVKVIDEALVMRLAREAVVKEYGGDAAEILDPGEAVVQLIDWHGAPLDFGFEIIEYASEALPI
jgi:hypothetical protein